MDKEKKKLILVYILIVAIIFLIIALTLVVLDGLPEKEEVSKIYESAKIDVNPYPNVSDVCNFNVTLNEYNALTMAGCKGGYTRYNVTDVNLDSKNVKLSIVYSDKNQPKVGLFINDRKVASKVSGVVNFKLGIFENKLFILDTNDTVNVLAFNKSGVKIYDLKTNLKEADLQASDLDSSSFIFTTNNFTFKNKSGTTYIVTHSDENFSKIKIA